MGNSKNNGYLLMNTSYGTNIRGAWNMGAHKDPGYRAYIDFVDMTSYGIRAVVVVSK